MSLKAKGSFLGKSFELKNDFSADPNRAEKRFSGLKSSKGGTSLQLVNYAPDGLFLKFWMVGVSGEGVINVLEPKEPIMTVPHITVQLGRQDNPTGLHKEKKADKKCEEGWVKLEKFVQDYEKGTCDIKGHFLFKWNDNTEENDGLFFIVTAIHRPSQTSNINLKAEGKFDVVVEDVGLTVK